MENKKIYMNRFSYQFPDYNLGVILDLILTDTFLDPDHNGYLSEGVVKLLNSYEILHEI